MLDDSKTLGDCGFTNQTARPQAPGTVGLAFRVGGELLFLNYLHLLLFSGNGHCTSLSLYWNMTNRLGLGDMDQNCQHYIPMFLDHIPVENI